MLFSQKNKKVFSVVEVPPFRPSLLDIECLQCHSLSSMAGRVGAVCHTHTFEVNYTEKNEHQLRV